MTAVFANSPIVDEKLTNLKALDHKFGNSIQQEGFVERLKLKMNQQKRIVSMLILIDL